MRKKIIVILIFSIFVTISLSGCNESDENKFVGTWEDQDGDIHHFFSDGTFNSINESITQSGSWEIKDNKLVITTKEGMITYDYSFSNNDNILKLTGPKTMILEKQ